MICKWAKLLGEVLVGPHLATEIRGRVKAAFSKQPGLWDSISRLAHFRLSHCFEGRGRRPQLFCLQSFVGQLCVRHHGACLWERPMSRLSVLPTCPLMRKGRAWILAHTQAVFRKVVWGKQWPLHDVLLQLQKLPALSLCWWMACWATPRNPFTRSVRRWPSPVQLACP